MPGLNQISIFTQPLNNNMFFMIAVVKTRSINEIQKLLINKFGDQDSIENKVLKIQDPLSFKLISIPCKGKNCDHDDFFDLENYLIVNKGFEQWQCPLCKKPTFWNSLKINSQFMEIMSKIQRYYKESDKRYVYIKDQDWTFYQHKQIQNQELTTESNNFQRFRIFNQVL